jgi:hypothetical protein
MLGTPDFWRLRLGIGHPGDRAEVVNYVLKKPSPDHRDAIAIAIERSAAVGRSAARRRDGQGLAQIHAKPPRPKPPRPAPAPAAAPAERPRTHPAGAGGPMRTASEPVSAWCALLTRAPRWPRWRHALGGAADDVALRARRPGLHRPPLRRRRRRRAGTAADAAGAGRGARGVGARARGRRAAGAERRAGTPALRDGGGAPAGIRPLQSASARDADGARPRRHGAPRPPWPQSREPCGRQRPPGLGVTADVRLRCFRRPRPPSTAVNGLRAPSAVTLASNCPRLDVRRVTGMQLTGQTCTHCGSSKWPTHSVQRAGSMT